MGAKWFKFFVDVPDDPKFLAAGHLGWCATIAAWTAAKAYDRDDGDVTKYWRAETIARKCLLDKTEGGIELAQQGMDAAERAGLVKVSEGRVIIHNWEERQGKDMTAATRQARKRERDKCDMTVTSRDVTDVTRDSRDVTQCHGRSDQNRSEQNRIGSARDLSTPTTDTSASGTAEPPALSAKQKKEPKNPEATKLLQHYYDHYKAIFGRAPQVDWAGRDLTVAKSLLAGPPVRSLDELSRLVELYLSIQSGKVADEGHPFAWLPMQINSLLARQARPRLVLGDPNS